MSLLSKSMPAMSRFTIRSGVLGIGTPASASVRLVLNLLRAVLAPIRLAHETQGVGCQPANLRPGQGGVEDPDQLLHGRRVARRDGTTVRMAAQRDRARR